MRTIVFWGLYWGTLIWGNYQLTRIALIILGLDIAYDLRNGESKRMQWNIKQLCRSQHRATAGPQSSPTRQVTFRPSLLEPQFIQPNRKQESLCFSGVAAASTSSFEALATKHTAAGGKMTCSHMSGAISQKSHWGLSENVHLSFNTP